jgi:hypothetical protein
MLLLFLIPGDAAPAPSSPDLEAAEEEAGRFRMPPLVPGRFFTRATKASARSGRTGVPVPPSSRPPPRRASGVREPPPYALLDCGRVRPPPLVPGRAASASRTPRDARDDVCGRGGRRSLLGVLVRVLGRRAEGSNVCRRARLSLRKPGGQAHERGERVSVACVCACDVVVGEGEAVRKQDRACFPRPQTQTGERTVGRRGGSARHTVYAALLSGVHILGPSSCGIV